MQKEQELLNKQKEYFKSGETKSLTFRLAQLDILYKAIRKYEQEIMDALHADLNKSAFEAYATEIGIVLKEISFTKKKLKSWVKPKRVKTALTHIGSTGYSYAEPYGVALIISPWNYPFQLAIDPLVGAIAAGNCAILKLSELTPTVSKVIEKLIVSSFSSAYIAVVNGAEQESLNLLHANPDYIFFTGSTAVGKIVMEAAAKNLIPITLELGGKSPCIVHKDADLKIAAKRIAWGKFINAGQTCVAPDYVYVHQEVKQAFIEHFIAAVKDLYGEIPLENENFTHIVSTKHVDRLTGFLAEGKIIYGGKYDRAKMRIEPTLIDEVQWHHQVMKEEIFGPLLPILTYQDFNALLQLLKEQPKALALYFFSASKKLQEQILQEVSFGGGCINDTVYHMVSPYMPFGGVGSSGIGGYHGKASFDTFSHFKSVLKQTTRFDLPFRYPNFKNGLKYIRMFFK